MSESQRDGKRVVLCQHAGLNTSIGSGVGRVDKFLKIRLVFKTPLGGDKVMLRVGVCLETHICCGNGIS